MRITVTRHVPDSDCSSTQTQSRPGEVQTGQCPRGANGTAGAGARAKGGCARERGEGPTGEAEAVHSRERGCTRRAGLGGASERGGKRQDVRQGGCHLLPEDGHRWASVHGEQPSDRDACLHLPPRFMHVLGGGGVPWTPGCWGSAQGAERRPLASPPDAVVSPATSGLSPA